MHTLPRRSLSVELSVQSPGCAMLPPSSFSQNSSSSRRPLQRREAQGISFALQVDTFSAAEEPQSRFFLLRPLCLVFITLFYLFFYLCAIEAPRPWEPAVRVESGITARLFGVLPVGGERALREGALHLDSLVIGRERERQKEGERGGKAPSLYRFSAPFSSPLPWTKGGRGSLSMGAGRKFHRRPFSPSLIRPGGLC